MTSLKPLHQTIILHYFLKTDFFSLSIAVIHTVFPYTRVLTFFHATKKCTKESATLFHNTFTICVHCVVVSFGGKRLKWRWISLKCITLFHRSRGTVLLLTDTNFSFKKFWKLLRQKKTLKISLVFMQHEWPKRNEYTAVHSRDLLRNHYRQNE